MDKQTPEPIKAVEMKRSIQQQIYDETRDMTADELLAYFRTRIASSRFADFLATAPTQQQSTETQQVDHDL